MDTPCRTGKGQVIELVGFTFLGAATKQGSRDERKMALPRYCGVGLGSFRASPGAGQILASQRVQAGRLQTYALYHFSDNIASRKGSEGKGFTQRAQRCGG